MNYRNNRQDAELAIKSLVQAAEQELALEKELYGELRPLLEVFKQSHLWFSMALSANIKSFWINCFKEHNLTPELLISSFIEYSRANDYAFINEMIDILKTDSYFTDHMPHILDAFNAHKQGLYSLSIPCLLIQVESIARKDKHPDCRGKNAIENTISEIFSKSALDYFHIDTYKDYVINLLTKYIYENTKKLPDQGHQFLNRHAILHGTVIGYATEINSLRAFLLLESICKPFRSLLEELSSSKKDPN